MKMRVLREYKSQRVGYKAGQIIDVTPDEARWLRADSPGTFGTANQLTYQEKEDREKEKGLAKVARKRVRKPPKDKMVKAAKVDK